MRSSTTTIITGKYYPTPLHGIYLLLVLVVVGCQSAPVQEMSDARQAITVARNAGAEQLATRELREAEAFLASAQYQLEQRAFARARFDALAAKNSALQALSVAERISKKSRE